MVGCGSSQIAAINHSGTLVWESTAGNLCFEGEFRPKESSVAHLRFVDIHGERVVGVEAAGRFDGRSLAEEE